VLSHILEQQRVCQYRYPALPRLRKSIVDSIKDAQNSAGTLRTIKKKK
jgi:hypothetical protein